MEKENYIQKTIYKIIPIIFLATLFIGFIAFIIFTYLFAESGYISLSENIDPIISSQYATFIGGFIGTVFTFATILIVWMTYNVQREELNQTKDLLRLQQFESTFFNLLQIQRVIKNNTEFYIKNRITTNSKIIYSEDRLLSGDIFFEFAAVDLRNLYTARHSNDIKVNYEFPTELDVDISKSPTKGKNAIQDEHLAECYSKFFDYYHNNLGHYFRHTFHILKYIRSERDKLLGIKTNKIDHKKIKEKFQDYANILQAQMSSDELFLMFYNGLFFDKAFELIVEFRFVENLACEDLLDKERHENYYDGVVLKSRYELFSER